MKVVLLAAAMLAFLVGCAHAVPVDLDGTWPLYNSVPGTCAAATDTCKDLSQGFIYAQLQGRSDSTLVWQANIAGLYGRPFHATFERAEGTWFFWAATRDSSGNRACVSPLVMRILAVPPAPATLR